MNQLLFQELGVYTLLGDKPITSLMVYRGEPFSWEDIPEEWREKCIQVEDHTIENIDAWKQFSKNLTFTRFKFAELPCAYDKMYAEFFFINIEKTKKIWHQYQEKINEIAQTEISFEQGLEELDNPHSKLWEKILGDHYLIGAFYGFGEENMRYFLTSRDQNLFSEHFEGIATKDDFPIPIYATADPVNDATTVKYRKQRKEIKHIFKDKDVVDFTLAELQR